MRCHFDCEWSTDALGVWGNLIALAIVVALNILGWWLHRRAQDRRFKENNAKAEARDSEEVRRIKEEIAREKDAAL